MLPASHSVRDLDHSASLPAHSVNFLSVPHCLPTHHCTEPVRTAPSDSYSRHLPPRPVHHIATFFAQGCLKIRARRSDQVHSPSTARLSPPQPRPTSWPCRVPPDVTRALPSTQCMYVEAARTPTCSVPPIGALASMGALTSRSQVCTSLRLTHNRPRMRMYAMRCTHHRPRTRTNAPCRPSASDVATVAHDHVQGDTALSLCRLAHVSV